MSEFLLQVENLTRSFGGVVAVNNVSYGVREGVIKAIIGPNGAGKTTMFNLIAGNLPPTSGCMKFKGRNVTRCADYRMASMGIARTFQTVRCFHGMTVLENVMLGRHSHSHSGFFATGLRMPWMIREEKKIRQAAMEQLEFVALAHRADMPADSLPFKEQRLLEFARALAAQPALLLADEPAAGLNTRETKEIAVLLRRIHDTGVTILLVEHDMSLVMDISDEILVLDYGRRIAEGTPAEVRANKDVVAVYLGRRGDNA